MGGNRRVWFTEMRIDFRITWIRCCRSAISEIVDIFCADDVSSVKPTGGASTGFCGATSADALAVVALSDAGVVDVSVAEDESLVAASEAAVSDCVLVDSLGVGSVVVEELSIEAEGDASS
jgi:hypothetical protein